MTYVIEMVRIGSAFDPTWYSPTAAGLANIEIHLAVVCASLPIFWPSIEKTLDKIFVTKEVHVTSEYGRFEPRLKIEESEMQSISSDKGLAKDAEMPEGWEPFVGDQETGLGESETVIESLATKGSKGVRTLFAAKRDASK